MRLHITDFVDNQLEEIADNLLKTNSEYANAVETRKAVLQKIDPLLSGDKDVVLKPEHCRDIQEYMKQDFTTTAIEQRTFYRQGYLDCVDLLKGLGVL
jgi:hypothetical protein